MGDRERERVVGGRRVLSHLTKTLLAHLILELSPL